MKCEKFKDILIQYDLLDIPSNIREKLDEHRDECPDCAAFWEEQQVFSAMLKNLPEPEIDDTAMDRLHQDIMQRVRRESFLQKRERPRSSFTFSSLWPTVSVAAATLVVGLLLGRLLSVSGPVLPSRGNTAGLLDGYNIEDMRIQVVNQTTGDLEIEYSQSQDRKVSGNVNDPYIQKLLAYAMVKDENPGTRLRSVKLSTEMKAGNEIISALMTTVRSDENNGVRLKAMKALSEFPLTEEIKQLCVEVITRDSYPAMRMEAIQILTEADKIDDKDNTVLKKAAEEDDAEGVRTLINQYYNNLQGNPLEKR